MTKIILRHYDVKTLTSGWRDKFVIILTSLILPNSDVFLTSDLSHFSDVKTITKLYRQSDLRNSRFFDVKISTDFWRLFDVIH